MLLPEPYAEQLFEHRAELRADSPAIGRPARCRTTAWAAAKALSEAGQILACGVNHPLRIGNRLRQYREVGWLTEGDRVHEMGPGSCPAELDEVRALAVSESVRSFCVNRNRSSAHHEPLNGLCQLVRSLHE